MYPPPHILEQLAEERQRNDDSLAGIRPMLDSLRDLQQWALSTGDVRTFTLLTEARAAMVKRARR